MCTKVGQNLLRKLVLGDIDQIRLHEKARFEDLEILEELGFEIVEVVFAQGLDFSVAFLQVASDCFLVVLDGG